MNLDGKSLPWYLIGVLVTALLAVFYSVIRGNLVPESVAKLLREQAEKRADILQATVDTNTATIGSLVASVNELMSYAEKTERVLNSLHEQAIRVRGGRGIR